MIQHIFTYGILLVLFNLQSSSCSQRCYYRNNSSSNIVSSTICPQRCCYSGTNYYTLSRTCCSTNYASSAYWWIVVPGIFFAIFLVITFLKICCFKGRPMFIGRRKPVTFIPARAQPVIIHTNRNGLVNPPYMNNNTPSQYPTQNLGYTGPNYNAAYLPNSNSQNNLSRANDDTAPPKYEDLSLSPPNQQLPTLPAPIGFKVQ